MRQPDIEVSPPASAWNHNLTFCLPNTFVETPQELVYVNIRLKCGVFSIITVCIKFENSGQVVFGPVRDGQTENDAYEPIMHGHRWAQKPTGDWNKSIAGQYCQTPAILKFSHYFSLSRGLRAHMCNLYNGLMTINMLVPAFALFGRPLPLVGFFFTSSSSSSPSSSSSTSP